VGQRRFFGYLLEYNQVYMFKKPRRSEVGQYISEEGREKFYKKVSAVGFMGQANIKNIISGVAKLAIMDCLDGLTIKSEEYLASVLTRITDVVLGAKTGLFQIKEQLQQLLKYKHAME
jgi:hypothetical protein